MNIPGGGKNDIPNRLKRQFAIFNVPLPSVGAINNIFGALVRVSYFHLPMHYTYSLCILWQHLHSLQVVCTVRC